MTEGVSIREFARLDGCNDKLVRRAIQDGKLTAFADGKLDPALAGTGWRRLNRRGKPLDVPASVTVSGVKYDANFSVSQETGVVVRATIDDSKLSELDDFISRLLTGQFGTLAEAEQVKENALALKHILTARREADQIVEIEIAESITFDIFRASRDAWLNWPMRAGPLIAADLGLEADKVTEVLTSHVHQQLADLGEPAPDFTDK